MGTYQTAYLPGSRPGSGQITASSPPQLPAPADQPFFLALDEAMLRPRGPQDPERHPALWRRRLLYWVHQKRVGLWLALLIGLGALAYALAVFTDASHRYAPSYYEPKDMERWQWVQRGSR